ncbi:hypothetical protein EV196_101587 [Mariniflexile fucanivorans]|uniref:Uncharacterized protein n=1 Tax=Mariniflexile fucanivorans TaxID=264023 RepID=A0A4R1RRT3_9FLAO|nr:hypothetical protein [Mariniflexile fucanivorans]TCL69153.1 hypothetical protein EV196_101587 [Mariniflexile fucanivorans]
MATLDLKKSVLKYIDEADERLLKLMKALAESYQEDSQEDFLLNEDDYYKLDKRRDLHLKGKSASNTWDEVKKNARNAAR